MEDVDRLDRRVGQVRRIARASRWVHVRIIIRAIGVEQAEAVEFGLEVRELEAGGRCG